MTLINVTHIYYVIIFKMQQNFIVKSCYEIIDQLPIR